MNESSYDVRVKSWTGEANIDSATNLLFPGAIVRVTGINALVPVGTLVRLVELIGAAWVIELPDGVRTSLSGSKFLMLSPDFARGREFAEALDVEWLPNAVLAGEAT